MRLWGRVGMTFNLTDKEVKELKSENSTEVFYRLFNEGKIVFDGNTYFPDIIENEKINGLEGFEFDF